MNHHPKPPSEEQMRLHLPILLALSNVTQAELAAYLGRSHSSLNDAMNGRSGQRMHPEMLLAVYVLAARKAEAWTQEHQGPEATEDHP